MIPAGPARTSLELAWRAFTLGQFPVGATVTDPDGRLVATGINRIFDSGSGLQGTMLAHAEIEALAGLTAGGRHDDLTLTSSLEPCLLCMGAVVLSRVGTVEYLGPDPYGGASRVPPLNPQMRRYPWRVSGPAPGAAGLLGAALPYAFLVVNDLWEGHVRAVQAGPPEIVGLGERMVREDVQGLAIRDASFDRLLHTAFGTG